jgi:putrescine aminotransferase
VNLGHNHPELVEAMELVEALELVAGRPEYVQVWPSPLVPALALSPTRIAPGDLDRVFLCNSGAEAVEAAIQLVRGSSDRSGLLSTDGAFHGKTMGSLSVSGREVYRRSFGPLVPGCDRVPFGELDALEQLRTRAYGGSSSSRSRGRPGVVVPPDGYLRGAEELCRATGTLLVIDEV